MRTLTGCFVFALLAVLCAGAAIQQTIDGGYVVIGTTQTYTEDVCDFLVYKLNGAGVKVWRKNYGGDDGDDGRFIRQTADGGYIAAGFTMSYIHGNLPWRHDMLVYRLDSAGNKLWRKNYGGEERDKAFCVQPTSDGGYILAGTTESYTHGAEDMLVYKLDAAGNKQWRKNLGGGDSEDASYVIQTGDGGYLVCGSTMWYTGTDFTADFLLYKLDAAGSKQWRKNFGGPDHEHAYCVQQTADGGYVVVGGSKSYVHGGDGDLDMLIYRLNAAGDKLWRKNYGGVEGDQARAVRQTADGGFLIAGDTCSYVHGPGKDFDFLVYRLDGAGNKLWRKNLGGAAYDQCADMDLTADGGLVLFGDTSSYTHGSGDKDFLVYKLDGTGSKLWRRNLGGEEDDYTSD